MSGIQRRMYFAIAILLGFILLGLIVNFKLALILLVGWCFFNALLITLVGNKTK